MRDFSSHGWWELPSRPAFRWAPLSSTSAAHFCLGVLGTIVAQKVMPNSEAMRLALGVGFLGAFTTFSTFEFETHALFDDGSWLLATTNMLASLFVGLLAVRAGHRGREERG